MLHIPLSFGQATLHQVLARCASGIAAIGSERVAYASWYQAGAYCYRLLRVFLMTGSLLSS